MAGRPSKWSPKFCGGTREGFYTKRAAGHPLSVACPQCGAGEGYLCRERNARGILIRTAKPHRGRLA